MAKILHGQTHITVSDHTIRVTNVQMYLAFSAEHLRDAIRELEKAVAAQPQLLAHWNNVLAQWRAHLSVLQAEAR